jgi:hypothetical protein
MPYDGTRVSGSRLGVVADGPRLMFEPRPVNCLSGPAERPDRHPERVTRRAIVTMADPMYSRCAAQASFVTQEPCRRGDLNPYELALTRPSIRFGDCCPVRAGVVSAGQTGNPVGALPSCFAWNRLVRRRPADISAGILIQS